MRFCSRRWGKFSILLSFTYTGHASDTCYFPDGSVALNGIPCGPSPSKCCDSEGLCLSNGLCFQPSGNLLARSSCTDSTWSSSACTDICKTENIMQYTALTPCGSDLFCCNLGPDATECCLGNSGKFHVDDSTVQLPINDPSTVTSTVTKTLTETSTVTSTSVSISVVAASGGVFTSTETISLTATGCENNPAPTRNGDKTTIVTVYDGSATATSFSGTNSQKFSASCEDCSKKEIAIGAGVGAPLLLALIGALLLLFCRGKSFRRPWAQQPVPISTPLPDRGHLAPEFVGYGAATMRTYDGPRPQAQYQGYQARNEVAVRDASGVNELQEQTRSPVSFIDDTRHELAGQKNVYDQPPRY